MFWDIQSALQSAFTRLFSWVQANLAWAMGKLSHFHEGLLDAIAEHATSMLEACPLTPIPCTSRNVAGCIVQSLASYIVKNCAQLAMLAPRSNLMGVIGGLPCKPLQHAWEHALS